MGWQAIGFVIIGVFILTSKFPHRTNMTVNEAISCAKYENAFHGEGTVDLSELLKNVVPENLRDINRRIGWFQMANVSNMTGPEDAVKGLLRHPSVLFYKEIGSHVDGCADVVFEGLKDSSEENIHKQRLAYSAGESDIRVMVRDIVDTKFNGSWSAFFAVIVSETAHGYQLPEGCSQGIDEKGIDENHIYKLLSNRGYQSKELVNRMTANILECVAMALKEVRSVGI